MSVVGTSLPVTSTQIKSFLVSFDRQGCITAVDVGLLPSLGYEEEELIGQPWSVLVHLSSPDGSEVWSRLENGEHQSGVFNCVGKHGMAVPFEASFIPFLDDSGELSKVSAVFKQSVGPKASGAEQQAIADALSRVQGVAEFDLNVLLAVEDVGAPSESKVSHRRCLIVRGAGPFGPEYRGYLVDEVQALASAVPEPIPSLITKSWASRGGPACPGITEMIRISAPDGSRSNINVLHLAECEAPSTPPLALIA